MNLDATRRQNSSCDSCRCSKRRCVLLDDRTSNKSCKYCAHLGRKCTFNFVDAHATKRRRIEAEQNPPKPASYYLPGSFRRWEEIKTPPKMLAGGPELRVACPEFENWDQLLSILPTDLSDLADLISTWSGDPKTAVSTYHSSQTPSARSIKEDVNEFLASYSYIDEPELI